MNASEPEPTYPYPESVGGRPIHYHELRDGEERHAHTSPLGDEPHEHGAHFGGRWMGLLPRHLRFSAGPREAYPGMSDAEIASSEKPIETVNHPRHYNEHPSGVECIDIVEHFTFNVGNAVKYLWRAGLKDDDRREDLLKARWYVERELLRLEKEDS